MGSWWWWAPGVLQLRKLSNLYTQDRDRAPIFESARFYTKLRISMWLVLSLCPGNCCCCCSCILDGLLIDRIVKAWHDNIILITPVNNQVPVVQTSDSAIYRINLYPDRRLQSLFSLGLYASVSRRNERDECLSRLTPSATPVIIFMSRGFRSKGQEKGDTARSLSDKYQRN